jgi:hypothetical protein
MFPISAFQNTVLKLVAILERNNISFHLTGGVTGSAYGEPRLTQDIDVVIENAGSLASKSQLADEFSAAGFLFDDKSVNVAIEQKAMFQLFDPDESLKLDVYPRELIEGELSRSNQMPIFEGIDLPIVSRQDAAASKLIWIGKGSHKSRRDLRQLMRRCSKVEQDFVTDFAAKHSLASLLEAVLQEPDEIA